MVTIVSSEIIWKRVQEDGRYWVREKHIDDLGNVFIRDYMNGSNAEEMLPIHAQELQDQLNVEVDNG